MPYKCDRLLTPTTLPNAAGGFFVVNLPAWISWLKYLSYIYYALGGCCARVGCTQPAWTLRCLLAGCSCIAADGPFYEHAERRLLQHCGRAGGRPRATPRSPTETHGLFAGILLYVEFDGGHRQLYRCIDTNPAVEQCTLTDPSSPETTPGCAPVNKWV